MMDAISFVLGVQPTHLRTQNLKDLIYRGRIDGTESPEVCTYAHVLAIFEKSSGESMHLMRSVHESGSSDYKINDKSVTALQYQMTLKQENILVKARNFLVFQGDIENIAAQEPAQLSRLVETISGSGEFAEEYDRLKEEKDKAMNEYLEIFSKKRHLNTESKQYKEQMREREMFEATLNEKNTLRKVVNLYKIFHNERKHFQIKANIRKVTNLIEATKGKVVHRQDDLRSLISQHAAELLELNSIEAKVHALERDSAYKKRDLFPLQSRQKLLQSKIHFSEKKIADLRRDLESQSNERSLLEADLEGTKQALEEFHKRTAELEKQTRISPEGTKLYETLRKEFLSKSGSALEDEFESLSMELETYRASLNNLDLQSDAARDKIALLESDVEQNLQSSFDTHSAELESLLQLKANKESQKDELLALKQRIVSSELELNAELREVISSLDDYSSQQKETKKQKKLRDNVSMLRTLLKDGSIKGLMYELVTAEKKKYEMALSTVLGPNIDAIIVDTTATAYKCIEILRERRAGIASFIPLDSVMSDQINLNFLRSIHESARPAIDVVKFEDPAIERAVQYAISDTVIVEDLETARYLKWESGLSLSNKFVSLDGSVLHKSGLMTGGEQQQQHQRSGNLIRLNKSGVNDLEKRKADISDKLAKLAAEKPSPVDINNFNEEINQIDEMIPGLRSRLAVLERQIFEKNQEIVFNREVLQETVGRKEDKEKDVAEVTRKIEDCTGKIQDLQKQVYLEFCSKYKLSSISDFECLHGPAMRTRSREKAEIDKRLVSLKNKLEFQDERMAETDKRIDRLHGELSNLQSDLLVVEQTLAEKNSSVEEVEENIRQVKSGKGQLETQVSEDLRKTKEMEDEVKELEAELKSLGREMTHSEELMMKVDAERFNMLKNCKMDDVDLPLEDGFLDSLTLDVENVSEVAYQVHVDYSLLDVRYQETYSSRTEADLRARIESVENELKALTPNSKAMERLRQVDEKLKKFDRDFSKCKHEVNRVTAKFDDITTKRKDAFMDAFQHIADNIDRVYKQLTKSDASPLGGSAYLTLEDEEQPFSAGIKYHAMPPMKRFRDIDLLSGGEKSMAALALLFAIHSYHASPFFVLDEVDASLDNANVKRIAEYIKENAGPDFQFIVISLKSALFEHSDALVGIYRDQRENASRTVSLDLRKYLADPLQVPISGDREIAAES